MLLAWIAILGPAGAAGAHSAFQIAAVSTKGNEVTVRMVDAYGAPIAQVPVGAAATEPDKAPRSYVPLREGPAGSYTGTITPPAKEVYQLNLETTLAGEPFRGSLRVKAGENISEMLIPLAAVDGEEKQGLGWSAYLYIAALVVVAAATAMAMLRKKPRAGEGE